MVSDLQPVPESTPRRHPQGFRRVDVALLVLCASLCVLAWRGLADWRSQRDELAGQLEHFGTRLSEGQVLLQVQRERTSHHARLAVARSLIGDVMRGASASDGAEPLSLEERLVRLTVAREQARRALRDDPGSGQAHALLGASIYLERSLTDDPALVTRYADWEAPLLEAVTSSAAAIEPRRLLASAYLECWPALGDAKKKFARDLLRDLFRRDPVAFNGLATQWITAAPNPGEALALIPDRPEAWRFLEHTYARQADWETFCRVAERRLDALETRFAETLEEAGERLRLGDPATARTLCLEVVTAAPPSRRFAPWVDQALEIYPPGLQGLASAEPLGAWIRWALRVDELGRSSLQARSVSRLVDAVGDLEAPVAAHAALLSGDEYRLRLAEQSLVSNSKAWASHLIAKARRLVPSDPESAAHTLRQAGRPAHSRISYWLTEADVARAASNQVLARRAGEALADLRSDRWTALDWRFDGDVGRLWLLASTAAAAIELDLLAEGGGAAEVSWDGDLVALRAIRGRTAVKLEVDVTPGLHLLEVRGLGGSRWTPAGVRLVEPAG